MYFTPHLDVSDIGGDAPSCWKPKWTGDKRAPGMGPYVLGLYEASTTWLNGGAEGGGPGSCHGGGEFGDEGKDGVDSGGERRDESDGDITFALLTGR